MKKRYIILLLLIVTASGARAQKADKVFPVMFYNVENLFDTIDIDGFADEEFTPGSDKQWNSERYEKKITDIARVILSLPVNAAPAIVGFAEVENKTVLEDLINTPGLKDRNYSSVIIEGDDPRGIDCGLIFRNDLFEYIKHEMLPVKDISGNEYPLRGILHVQGKGPDGKPLHIYINHWKSRRGGVKETESLRIYSGIALRRELDKLLSIGTDQRVIIMGDFNDEPTNRSISDILKAGNKRKNPWLNDTYNLFYDYHNLDMGGSYNYQGTWQMYDQIIISYNLLNQEKGLSAGFDDGKVLMEEWMTYYDKKNELKVPNRTYGGNNYYGGISDHFPVYVVFKY